jgi:hypothetical protein
MKYRPYSDEVESFVVSIFKLKQYTTQSIARSATLKFGRRVYVDHVPKIIAKSGISGLNPTERASITWLERNRRNYAKPGYYDSLVKEMEVLLAT